MAEWLLGVGSLTIADVGVARLQGQVTYQDDGEIAERLLTRAAGGPRVVAERLLVKTGGTLRAETATLSSAVAAKLLQGSSPSGILPVYAVTYERTDAGVPHSPHRVRRGQHHPDRQHQAGPGGLDHLEHRDP